jgi:hypothetical protein
MAVPCLRRVYSNHNPNNTFRGTKRDSGNAPNDTIAAAGCQRKYLDVMREK